VPAAVGPTKATVVKGSRLWGVRLWPDTAALVLGLPPSAIDPQTGGAAFAGAGTALVARVAELVEPHHAWQALTEWATEFIAPRAPADAIVRAAIHAIVARGGDISTRELSAHLSLGARQLQRRFQRATGITIKSYARVRRMRAALSARLADSTQPWSLTAAGAGFADQAHLGREFAALTGLAPTRAAEHLARIAHRNVTP
jgi:transcriptional regulator GlxA family with amidase domain